MKSRSGPVYDVNVATSSPNSTVPTYQDVPKNYVLKGYSGGTVLSSSYKNGKYITIVEVFANYEPPS
ncbi:hypothetical protein HQ447_03070 [bacterium]|nr:hypothetical protein [bacterium]